MNNRPLVHDILHRYGGFSAFARYFKVTERSARRYFEWGFFSQKVALQIQVDTNNEYQADDLVDPRHVRVQPEPPQEEFHDLL